MTGVQTCALPIYPLQGKISNESPIGRAFLGKKKGEEFKLELPNGKKVGYRILKIS